MADPSDVLADLLLAAVEADRVSETYDLLVDLVGKRPVREAHGIVFDRIALAVEAAADPAREADATDLASPATDVFDLTRRLRAKPVRRRR